MPLFFVATHTYTPTAQLAEEMIREKRSFLKNKCEKLSVVQVREQNGPSVYLQKNKKQI